MEILPLRLTNSVELYESQNTGDLVYILFKKVLLHRVGSGNKLSPHSASLRVEKVAFQHLRIKQANDLLVNTSSSVVAIHISRQLPFFHYAVIDRRPRERAEVEAHGLQHPPCSQPPGSPLSSYLPIAAFLSHLRLP